MSNAATMEAVLFAALEKSTLTEQLAYLDSACADDPELRRQVEKLLLAQSKVGDFLLKPVVELLAPESELRDSNVTTDHGLDAASTVDPAVDTRESGLPAVPGYQVLREIARGGMGRVLAARGPSLDRDVALKVLLPGANADRFVRESKITARLPHPGIPPVHALGTLADGSPFLAMKLIAGHTLAVEIKTADRPRLLQVFTQVCQAVGFAHSLGIVHRDLKPANVMVGAFGEVQVMDWGLAKDLRDEGERNKDEVELPITPDAAFIPPPSSFQETQAGTILGTPEYMAPEQARGEACEARSDVFALGGILCAILTGKPPYRGKSSIEVIRRARAADLGEAHARLDACGADAELVALCRGCLNASPADRPADGRTVADGLSAYIDGVQERLQTAQRERAVALAREAEQRKKRKVQLALAAAVVALLLGGGAFAWWQNARLGRNNEAVAAHLDQIKEALRTDDVARAKVALEAARKRSAEGGAEKQAARLGFLEADLVLLRALDQVDKHLSTWVRNSFPDPKATAPLTRAALRQFGVDPDTMSVDVAAARVSVSALRERIIIALDRLLWQQKTAEVRALLRRVDADPYRDAVRDALLSQDDEKECAELAKQDAALKQPAGFVAFLSELRGISLERRLELLQAAVNRQPGNRLLLMTRSIIAFRTKSVDERLRWCQAAVAAAPENFAARMNLGSILCDVKQDYEGAIACFEKALDLDPNNVLALFNLAHTLARKGKVDEAIAGFEKTLALEPNYSAARNYLGEVLKSKGQWKEAFACFEKCLEIDPKDVRALNSLGTMLAVKSQWEEAIAYFKKAVDIDPKEVKSLINLGTALTGKNEVEEAITWFEKAMALEPKNAAAHLTLGNAWRQKGQLVDAIAWYRKAIELDQKFAKAHINLGTALSEKEDWDEAIASLRQAIEVDPKNAEAHFELGNALSGKDEFKEAFAHYRKAAKLDPMYAKELDRLGTAQRRKGRLDEAIDCYLLAIAVNPKNAAAHNNLGGALEKQGKVNEAIARYRQAIALDPKLAVPHYNLGFALQGKGELNEAIDCHRQAIALDPNYDLAHSQLGGLLYDKGQFEEAIVHRRKVVELKPQSAVAHANLGNALKAYGQLDEAVTHYRQAVDLNPRLDAAHDNLGSTLYRLEKLDEAIAAFQECLRHQPQSAHAHDWIAFILLRKGDSPGALPFAETATNLNPNAAQAHYNLGRARMGVGDLENAVASLKKAIALDAKHAAANTHLAKAERLVEIRDKFGAVRLGAYTPASNAERIEMAGWCNIKKFHRTATRLFADAFAADPKLAEDLKAAHRYAAACHAALAAAGQGDDAGKLDDPDKARLRRQSLDWLRADLVLRTGQLQSGQLADRDEAVRKLTQWQNDRDLASLRNKFALAKLPGEERAAWQNLWADVTALLKKAEIPAPKVQKLSEAEGALQGTAGAR